MADQPVPVVTTGTLNRVRGGGRGRSVNPASSTVELDTPTRQEGLSTRAPLTLCCARRAAVTVQDTRRSLLKAGRRSTEMKRNPSMKQDGK